MGGRGKVGGGPSACIGVPLAGWLSCRAVAGMSVRWNMHCGGCGVEGEHSMTAVVVVALTPPPSNCLLEPGSK